MKLHTIKLFRAQENQTKIIQFKKTRIQTQTTLCSLRILLAVTSLVPSETRAQSAYKHTWCMINRICRATQAYIHGCLNFIWWFNFKCLQHQITWRASTWLWASAAQTGHVSMCVCWLCANRWQKDGETEWQSNKDVSWMTKTNNSHHFHLWVNLFKSFLSAQVRSHYCSCWW